MNVHAMTAVNWRSVAALNAVSTFAQIAQAGLGFMVLPIWLAHQGLDAPRAGQFSSAQCAGMLVGLLVAPTLLTRIGAKQTVMLGLAATFVAFAAMGFVSWPLWIVPGTLIGVGLGLRWIGNETWLYGLVPPESSGRVVGVHEALIATSGVIAPALATWSDVDGRITFAAGAGFTLLAALPLWFTPYDRRRHVTPRRTSQRQSVPSRRTLHTLRSWHVEPIDVMVCLGMVVAAVGGLSDGALFGLLPLFAAGHGMSGAQTATLLTILGVGSIALQFPVGWFADRAGLTAAVVSAAAANTLAALGFVLAESSSWQTAASALLLGGSNSAFLTLGMVAAASAGAAQPGRSMRLISMSFGLGAIVGPLIAGYAMKAFGSDMLMWLLALLSGALTLYALGVREGSRRSGRMSSPG
ncbi:MFS transporter [Paraburkholderia acidicola]|uniref:MFS transporter n=1 Tax=Paraburkholderia acidicola TaxID=1912599 RepID=A0A2A4EPH6_9BURK|nr:MFS transporter [Paraburkholderia acidicola]PCE22725.1 MFS transporter [Paraburkholderia acidicola]